MKMKWELEHNTVFEAKFVAFGRNTVTVDGVQIPGKVSLLRKGELAYDLSHYRKAVLSIQPGYVTAPTIQLHVDGKLMVDSRKETSRCTACGKSVIPNDRFCASCGATLPTAEHYGSLRQVAEATGVGVLAWLFLISGVIMFFVGRSQANAALEKLSALAPDALIPGTPAGESFTVAALRTQLAWEPWAVLIVNVILALVMAILFFWGKKSPLAAVLIATATYAVVIVVGGIVDPATIAQGLIIKIFIVAMLVKGIRAGLELRAVQT